MLSKCSLRLKLSDFINTDIENQVMEKINQAHDDLNTAVLLYLWYEEGEIKSKDLKDFLVRWEDKLQFKTIIKQGHNIRPYEFIFWDILPVDAPSNEWHRFTYNYVNEENILDGLKKFYVYTKFITTDKPFKKQKRNDYED